MSNQHTCIKDDGGTPNRKCYACETEKQPLFYIENVRSGGDCCIWWLPDGKGYTRDLDEAWKVDEAKAISICRSRPEQDKMRNAADVDAQAVRHLGR